MSLYADTCLLLSLFLRDSGTEAALAWLKDCVGQPILASHWSLTEFSSAASNMARRGQLVDNLHKQALARFREFARARLTLEALQPGDFERAATMVDRHATGLRAGDALHLALCDRLGATLCSADRTMLKAAEAYGVDTRKVG